MYEVSKYRGKETNEDWTAPRFKLIATVLSN